MAINTITYASLLQKKLDEQVTALSTSGWMEANAGQVQYNGGREVKVPSLSTTGLTDYDRDNGFIRGAVTLSHETLTMTQDRSASFVLDAMDVNESNFLMNATAVANDFQRNQVIPEIDAYRYSKIYALANANSRVAAAYDPAKATIIDALLADIAAIRDVCGWNTELVISMSATAAAVLEQASILNKQLDVTKFKQGNVELDVKSIDGAAIIKVPSARMKTAYVFNDGTTSGQEKGGFTPAGGAKQINWIITPKNVPIAVSKTEKLRIFAPDVNQNADAWKIDYRKYHELWITANKMNAIMVNISST